MSTRLGLNLRFSHNHNKVKVGDGEKERLGSGAESCAKLTGTRFFSRKRLGNSMTSVVWVRWRCRLVQRMRF